MPTVSFTLNGTSRTCDVRPGETLLDTLRERCGIHSTKNGCSPQGQCGACLAIIDGKPKVTCATPAEKAEGRDIITLEGLEPAERALIADSFVAAAGLQCGFCIPGFVLRTRALLERNPTPTRDEIAKAVDVHLCRCTGYVKIIDAIDLVARARRGEATPQVGTDGAIGASLGRYQGRALVLGDRPYVDDLRFDDMLHGAVVLSAHARAKVVRIDTRKAQALDGVFAVATASDIPGERWYGIVTSDWPGMVAEGEETRCVGDVVAIVAAVDRHTAREAADLVEVTYEVREPTLDPAASIVGGARQINPAHANVLSRTAYRRGDVEGAFAGSAHVVEGTWTTQRIEHLFLEPESCVAMPRPEGGLHLFTQGQGVFDDRRQLATYLAMDPDAIFVELVPNGGAFGGKEDMTVQPHAALLSLLTGRPVKVALSREESVRVHPKRHPITMTYKVGCDAAGKLTAVQAYLLGDTGAYASVGSKVLERAAGHACGPYRVVNVDVEAIAAYTNNPPCGAMRGFGANQASFAIEGALDMLAEKVGLDGWEIRWRNAIDVGDTLATGQILEKSVGVRKTLQAVKDKYYAARATGRAVGIACGIKNSGLGNGAKEWGKARIVVEPDGTLSLYNGFTEMGQGLFTILTQCVVEVTGLDASLFRPKVDSNHVLEVGQTTGSRGTLLGGRAAIAAGEALKVDLDAGKTLQELVGTVYAGDFLIDDTTAPGAAVEKVKTHTTYGFATQVCVLDEAGRVDTVIAAHDVGRALNPALCEGQIEGGIHMGLGFALSEDLPCEDGMPVTFKMRELGVLRARDMPVIETILVEEHEPEGPFGAKGLGEIGLVPTAGAVAGALAQYDGVRRMQLPMKDSPAGRAISVGRIRCS